MKLHVKSIGMTSRYKPGPPHLANGSHQPSDNLHPPHLFQQKIHTVSWVSFGKLMVLGHISLSLRRQVGAKGSKLARKTIHPRKIFRENVKFV